MGTPDHQPGQEGVAPLERQETAASEAGTVVLDIGGRLGAAVVYVNAGLDGVEIEIRQVGTPWDGTHTAVHERHLPNRSTYAGVFPALLAGYYEIRLRDAADDGLVMSMEIHGGEVTETHWPSRAEAGARTGN